MDKETGEVKNKSEDGKDVLKSFKETAELDIEEEGVENFKLRELQDRKLEMTI